jgi:hypothetical protein
MKKNIGVYVCLLFIYMFAGCGSNSNIQKSASSTDGYYVHTDGNDRNTGTSEAAAFRTLTRAINVASRTSLKKITVIGTLVETVSTEDATISFTRRTDWDDPNLGEILITGKPNATGNERAVLTAGSGQYILLVANYFALRLENIEISGANNSPAVFSGGELTLAQGVKIINNNNEAGNAGGVHVMYGGLLIMRDNAEISNNTAIVGGGIVLGDVGGSTSAILVDNALITNNKASTGAGIAITGSRLVLGDNATISNNNATQAGGGIFTSATDSESGSVSTIMLYTGSKIINNSAGMFGGGIFLNDELLLDGIPQITGNTASQIGGGGVVVNRRGLKNLGGHGEEGKASIKIIGNEEIDDIIKNNQAPRDPNVLIIIEFPPKSPLLKLK